MVKVIIADDHPIFRRGLKQIIEEDKDIKVADEAGNFCELIKKISQNDYDVAIVDITMPGKIGLDGIKDIKTLKPELPILILSMHSEERYGVSAIKVGASGYLQKSEVPEKLIEAIRKIHLGQKFISPNLAELIADSISPKPYKNPNISLSDREYQVMSLTVSGKTVKEIAGELFISIQSVSTYRARILTKLHLNNTAELIHYAVESHLVDL